MGVIGFILWFKLAITSCLPGWLVDVALSIHWYETLLAVSAIVVWHLYHVIFDPEVYPLNPSILDGRVSRKWHQREHPLDPELEGKPAKPSRSDQAGQ